MVQNYTFADLVIYINSYFDAITLLIYLADDRHRAAALGVGEDAGRA